MIRFLVFALTLSVACANPATIAGLIGKATYQTQSINRDLDAQTGPIARAVFADILVRHAQVGRDLRTAFALSALDRAPVGGFYFAALASHRKLNDRLLQITAGTPDRERVVAAMAGVPLVGR